MATLTLDISGDGYREHSNEIIGRRWDGYHTIELTGFFQKIPHIMKALKYMVSNADNGCAFTLTDSSITDADRTDAIVPRAKVTDTWYGDFKDFVYRDVDSWSVTSGVLTFTKKS